MNNSRLGSNVSGTRWEAKQPFNLVIAYDDHATRDRALHLSHHLSKQLENDYDFHCSWWKFDHLANEILREQAAHAAAEANMIVVAMNARPDLSPLQSAWLESWLPKRHDADAALVALLANQNADSMRESERTASRLRGMAREANLDFFIHAFDLPGKTGTTRTNESTQRQPSEARATSQPTTNAPAADNGRFEVRMPIPRWGINE